MAAAVPQLRKDPEAPLIAPRLKEHQLNVDYPTVPFLSRDDPADVISTPSDVVSSPPDVILSLPNDEEPVAFLSQVLPGNDLPSHEDASQGDIAASPSDDQVASALPSLQPEAFPALLPHCAAPVPPHFPPPPAPPCSPHSSGAQHAEPTVPPQTPPRAGPASPSPQASPSPYVPRGSLPLSPNVPVPLRGTVGVKGVECVRGMEGREGEPVIGRCTMAGVGKVTEREEKEEREAGTKDRGEERREDGRERGAAAVMRGGEGGGEAYESAGWCATSSTSSVLVGGDEEEYEREECEGRAEAEETRERDCNGQVEGESEDRGKRRGRGMGERRGGRAGGAGAADVGIKQEGDGVASQVQEGAVAAAQAGLVMGSHGVAAQGQEGVGAEAAVQAGGMAGTDGLASQAQEGEGAVTAVQAGGVTGTDGVAASTGAWVPPVSPFGLIQERLYRDPWKLLVACMLLNKTAGRQLHKVIWDLFRLIPSSQAAIAAPTAEIALTPLLRPPPPAASWMIWDLFRLIPSPEAAIAAPTAEIARTIQSLGLHNKRAAMIQRFSEEFLRGGWTDVRQLHGIGKYATDAHAIFCEGSWWEERPTTTCPNIPPLLPHLLLPFIMAVMQRTPMPYSVRAGGGRCFLTITSPVPVCALTSLPLHSSPRQVEGGAA
ncbi:unnamed protein product [Closterium sp. Naga37s-1]|nr:unnamed protein product [Closterium sp. Naga37s-1]